MDAGVVEISPLQVLAITATRRHVLMLHLNEKRRPAPLRTARLRSDPKQLLAKRYPRA